MGHTCMVFQLPRTLGLLAASALVFWLVPFASAAEEQNPPPKQPESAAPPADPKLEPTHAQTAIIKVVNGQGEPVPLNTFCLTKDGQLLAGVGQGPGEVRVYDADGKQQACWAVPVKPEAVNVAPDGTVYVAGLGQLLKLDAQGKVLLQKEAPHAAAIKANAAKVREEVVAQNKQRAEAMAQQEGVYQQQIDRLQKELEKLAAKPAETLTRSRKDSRRKLQVGHRAISRRPGGRPEVHQGEPGQGAERRGDPAAS